MKRVLREMSLNWKSGLTVALVSVPLSISLAIASGATPLMGIITAIWAGLVAAIFGGSRFNVVGPAGALSGILAVFALSHGMELMPLLAILSGLIMVVFYVLRWDRYLVFIPSSVMHGFTLGVGLTIGLGQLNFALGLKNLPVHETFLANIGESFAHLADVDPSSVLIFIATLCLMFGLARFAPRVPGAVVAAVIGIAIGYLSQAAILPYAIQTLFTKYGEFRATLIQPPSFDLSLIDLGLFTTAVTVAVVAVLETLLSAKIADGMTKSRFDQKKETLGLALANIASGAAGGLPATGVFARTALNVKTGATSQWSSGMNAVFVLVISLLLFRGFQFLPLAVVAGILVFAAFRMVDPAHFRRLFFFDKSAFALSLVVAILTVGVDAMAGIMVGATISLLIFVQHLSRGQSELTLHKNKKLVARIPHHHLSRYADHHDVIVYRFAGELTYFNGKSHEEAMKKIKADTLILSLRNLFYIDVDGLETLQEIIEHQEASGKTVIITGAGEFIRPQLHKTSWFKKREKDGSVFGSTTEALKTLGFPLGS